MAHGQGDLAQSPPPEGAGTPPGKASAPSETVAGAQPQTPRDVEEPPRNALDRIKAFLSAYTRTYESMNLSAFQSFFDPQATENGTPFRTLLAKYKENYARLDALKYRIDLTECNEDRSLGVVRVKGKFCMRWRSGGEWDETCGTISLDLLPHGDSFKVKTLEYRYGT